MSDMSSKEPRQGAPPPVAFRHSADISTHPDAMEMRERFARVLKGPRATVVDGLTVLTGLYVAISPWIVHFQTTNTIMTVNNLVIGLAIAALGLGMAARPGRLMPLGWVVSTLGAWVIVSPWVASIGHHATRYLIWTNAFSGGTAFVLGLAAMGILALGLRRSRT
ncbi:MAG TPA: SPW repeat protein [Actinospica sp.]|nr:SPW repeat protein [Actinospica sp.]